MTMEASGMGELLRVLTGQSQVVMTRLEIAGEPTPKMRHRTGRTGRGKIVTYVDDKQAANEQYLSLKMKELVNRPVTGNVALVCLFYRSTCGSVDADNLIKQICDCGNGILWVDDRQITAVAGIIQLDPQFPRTILAFAQYTSTLVRK